MFLLSLIATLWLLFSAASGAQEQQVISSVRELRALTEGQARDHLPVELVATLYYRDPSGFGFIGDDGEYLCVENLPDEPRGSRLRIVGRTSWGSVNNMLHAMSCDVVGSAPLAAPQHVSGDHLSLAEHDCRWVTSSGKITYVRHSSQTTAYGIEAGGQKFEVVRSSRQSYEDSLMVIEGELEFTGNVAPNTDAVTGCGFNIFCSPDHIRVLKPSAAHRQPLPVRTHDMIWMEPETEAEANGFRLSGQVVYVAPYHDFMVEHNDMVIWVGNPFQIRISCFEYVEVSGDRHGPDEDHKLVARMVTTFGAAALQPASVFSARDIQKDQCDHRRIRLYGTVVRSEFVNGEARVAVDSDGVLVDCRISADPGHYHSLDLQTAQAVAVSGVASFHQPGEADFRLFVASPADFVVESRNSVMAVWWLLSGAGMLLGLSLFWGRSLVKKVRRGRLDLRRTTAELKMSIDAIDDAILILDLDGAVLHSSRGIRELFDVRLHPGEDGNAVRTALASAPGAEEFVAQWDKLSQDRYRTLRRLRLELQPPLPQSLEVTSSPVTDDVKEVIGRLWVFRDVSTREQLQQQLIHAQKQEAIGQLAGGFAHDFNNILTGISGSLDLARADQDRTIRECMGHLTVASEASLRASSMVSQLLGFSRKTHLDLRPNDVNEIVRRTQDLLYPTLKGTVELSVDLAGELPRVNVDANQLQQVLLNVWLNAVDAIEGSGKITVKTHPVPATDDQSFDTVCISIADDGVGMTPETMERIFEPYFSTKVGSGVGLGLAMSQGIIQQHEGDISCESKPGWGTEFRILLPGAAPPDHQARPALPQPASRRLDGKRLLVVDDEQIVRSTVAQLLELRGAVVTTQPGGHEALAYLQANAHTVDFVLLDWTMPVLSGRETLVRIRQTYPSLPVVVTSGFTFDCNQWAVDDPSAPNAILQKPFRIEELCHVLDSLNDNRNEPPTDFRSE